MLGFLILPSSKIKVFPNFYFFKKQGYEDTKSLCFTLRDQWFYRLSFSTFRRRAGGYLQLSLIGGIESEKENITESIILCVPPGILHFLQIDGVITNMRALAEIIGSGFSLDNVEKALAIVEVVLQRSDQCASNCSFSSGHGALGFWPVALALLAPPRRRPAVIAAALAFGTAVGVMRIAQGGHFLSDVVFSALLTISVAEVLARRLLPKKNGWGEP